MTIDERLQFLVESTESLHASCQELHAAMQAMQESIRKHDERWERVRRVVRAALEAGFGDDGDGDDG
jgi:hypothetical protein